MRSNGRTRAKPKKLNGEKLWEYALSSLARRAQSKAEIRRKLVSRAETLNDVDAVLEKLTEYQMADDTKFSEAFAASRLQNQGLGKFRVLRDLRAKQVPERVASEAIEKAYSDTNEADLIARFLQRKYRNTNLPAFLKEPQNWSSAYRRLRMAGFGSGASVNALKQLASLPDDWAEPDEAEEE